MERIAIISDIHANLHALERFMKYIDEECSVSTFLNMGDFIQIGPNPREVFDIVMTDPRFVNIKGNSEAMYFDDDMKKHYSHELAHQNWVEKQLGSKRMQQLQEVPLRKIVELGKLKFLMIHARPNSAMESPLLYQQRSLEEFIADYNADVNYIFIGHTHLPLYAVYWNNKPVINPGSIGCGKDGIVRFVVLELDDGIVNVNYKQLRYHKEKVIDDYHKYKVPYGDQFISMFY